MEVACGGTAPLLHPLPAAKDDSSHLNETLSSGPTIRAQREIPAIQNI